MSGTYLKVTSDFLDDFNEIVSRFKNDAVLVGIPAEKSARDDGSNGMKNLGAGEINNATILAINHFGGAHIPPRPVLNMGINDAQDDIADQFSAAAQNALGSQGAGAINIYYNRAGIIAASAVKSVINNQGGVKDGPIEGPAKSTLARRKAAGFKGTKSLIITGQLRNAITYVVKEV